MDWEGIWLTFKDTIMHPVSTVSSSADFAMQQLKGAARDWAAKVVKLYESPVPQNRDLAEKRQALLDRARTIKEKLESIFGTIDSLSTIQLGVLPLIVPAAVIAAAAAAVSYWVYDYNKYSLQVSESQGRITQYNRMVSDGINPSTAAKMVSNISSVSDQNTTMNKAVTYLPWLAGAFLLYTFRDKLK